MPIYTYKCECGLRFEKLRPRGAAAPQCPECGTATAKIPSLFSQGGKADAGLAQEMMPQTWKGVYNGNREYITKMRKQWEKRQKLEAKHPDLAGDQRPILAHEGLYHGKPLRLGDAPADAIKPAGHSHPHPHPHPHPAPAKPAATKE